MRNVLPLLVGDHTLALDELERIAHDQKLTLPDPLGPAQRGLYTRLWQLSGQAFDDAYTQHMETSHEDAIRTFKTELRSGSDPQLKAYAERQLPMLRAHEQNADIVQRQLGRGTTPATTSPR